MPSVRTLIQDALYQRIPKTGFPQPPKATLGSALRIDTLTSRGEVVPLNPAQAPQTAQAGTAYIGPVAQAMPESDPADALAQSPFPRKPHLNDLAATYAAQPILPQPPIPRSSLNNVLREMDRATGSKPLMGR